MLCVWFLHGLQRSCRQQIQANVQGPRSKMLGWGNNLRLRDKGGTVEAGAAGARRTRKPGQSAHAESTQRVLPLYFSGSPPSLSCPTFFAFLQPQACVGGMSGDRGYLEEGCLGLPEQVWELKFWFFPSSQGKLGVRKISGKAFVRLAICVLQGVADV